MTLSLPGVSTPGNFGEIQSDTGLRQSAGPSDADFRAFLEAAVDGVAGRGIPTGHSPNVNARPSVAGGQNNADIQLVKAVGMIRSFLDQNPAIANTPFGHSVNLLLHVAGNVTEADAAAGLPRHVRNKLMTVVTATVEYIEKHRSIMNSAFGSALLELVGEILETTEVNPNKFNQALLDRLQSATSKLEDILNGEKGLAARLSGTSTEDLMEEVMSLPDDEIVPNGIAAKIANATYYLNASEEAEEQISA